jgi:predicted PurR-regulated permease PerM
MEAERRAVAPRHVARAVKQSKPQDELPLPPPRPSTVALTLIALILGLFAIRMGAAFFIPLLLSLFLNYALSPVVGRLAGWGLPRAIAAALVILAFGAAIAGALYRVGSDAGDVLQEIPSAVQRLRIAVTQAQQDHTGTLEHVQRTASELQKLAEAASPAPAAIDAQRSKSLRFRSDRARASRASSGNTSSMSMADSLLTTNGANIRRP